MTLCITNGVFDILLGQKIHPKVVLEGRDKKGIALVSHGFSVVMIQGTARGLKEDRREKSNRAAGQ